MFAGDAQFFADWVAITGKYGLIVNEEKTGISRRYLEVNSQVYDCLRHSRIEKSVLSFLRPDKNEPGSILLSVIRGMAGFRVGTVKYALETMRHEISLRGVVADLGELPSSWRKYLVKRAWFRLAAMLGGAQVIKKGTERCVPTVIGQPPREEFFGDLTTAAAVYQRIHTERWKGVRVSAAKKSLDRSGYLVRKKEFPPNWRTRHFEWAGYVWAFVWPEPLFEAARNHGMLESRTRNRWMTDHPFLARRPRIVEVERPRHCVPNFAPPSQQWDKWAQEKYRWFRIAHGGDYSPLTIWRKKASWG
jgi:hypothetical protein